MSKSLLGVLKIELLRSSRATPSSQKDTMRFFTSSTGPASLINLSVAVYPLRCK